MRLGPFDVPGYHVGDCRELLRQLPDGCVQTCVTSPPYWGLRDYGVDGQIGLEATPTEFVETMVEVFREVRRLLRDDGTLWLNLGDTYATGAGAVGGSPGGGEQGQRWAGSASRGYRGDRLANGRKDHNAVLRRKTRADRDGAHAGKNTAMTAIGPMTQPNRMPIEGLKPKDLIGVPWEMAFALRDDGWWLRQDIIWSKPSCMPESVRDRCTKSHEYLFLLSKSEQYFWDADAISEPVAHPRESTAEDAARAFSRLRATTPRPTQEAAVIEGGAPQRRNKRSVWTIATTPTPDAHFATFPQKLVEPCILAGSRVGDVVLDPFGGSGTVGRVAEDLGRRWLLFDLNPAYAKIAARKTAQMGLLGRMPP